MSGKRDWRKARLHGKRSVSVLDEQEYRDRDAASRWLERNEKAKPAAKIRSFMSERRSSGSAS